ncbi:hypothetical protein, partial [Gluconobacter cerinus]|uniref:hypothetical protein n=1 Tax=Gluconobacter cerinus TaxID=38307 RepID=UPI001B8B73D2
AMKNKGYCADLLFRDAPDRRTPSPPDKSKILYQIMFLQLLLPLVICSAHNGMRLTQQVRVIFLTPRCSSRWNETGSLRKTFSSTIPILFIKNMGLSDNKIWHNRP